jgi:N-acetylglucosamine-6-phosphate deacetylase
MAEVIEAGPRESEATPLGIHIEGPFLSHAKRGMHPAEHLQAPSIDLFERLYAAARGHIRLMTLAPEAGAVASPGGNHADSALDLIRHATARGVRCSIGHSNALAAETRPAIAAGAVSATHTFNAMRPLDHREPGILGIVLDDPRLYADLICDGVHVAPELVRLWLRAKGRERAILITDALAATGMPDGHYMLGSSPITVFGERALVSADLAHGKQTLAGSVLTLDRAVNRLREFTGASLADATRLASHNPAAMLGLAHVIRLEAGNPATFNRFDSEGRLLSCCVRGREMPADS